MSTTQIMNIILDLFIIICAALTVLISILVVWIMLFHQSRPQASRTAHLLCINMYVSLGISCTIILDVYCYTLYGHMHPNVSFNGPWCHLKCYFFYVSSCSFFYSFLLQVSYRLCRIVFYTKPVLQSFHLYIGGIALQWVFSFLQVIPIYLLGTFEYLPHDYHCQIALSNLRGLLLSLLLVHLIPVSLTTACYIYTFVYIRLRHNPIRTARQRVSDRRDLFVLSRVFILFVVMIGSVIPQMGLSIFCQYYGYLPYWSTQIQWLTATFSVLCVAFILMFIPPNLQEFFRQSRSPQIEMVNM